MSHLQRVFSSPLGQKCPTFSPCCPDQRNIYVPLTKSLYKSAGIKVSHIFSMLPSTFKYLYSVEPVRTHFPAKQPYCTNDSVCNAALHNQYEGGWPCHPPSYWLRLFSSQTFSRINTPTFSNLIILDTGWTQKHSLISSSYKIKTYWNIFTNMGLQIH